MSGTTIAGEVRLDNRQELLRALGIDRERAGTTGDLALAGMAYDRWGDACPGKLLGDFAFVVRDGRTGRAFGARDHLGAKPFYYRASDLGLAFAVRASVIGEVDGLPLELNEARIADACVPELECVDRTSSLYRGVFRLPPAHRLTFEAGRVATERYWAPDPARELQLFGDADYAEAFREAFGEAVRCRLAGPAAAMLSGGLDSSAIVGFARAIRRGDGEPLTTLSAVTADPACEESHHVRAVLGLTGLDPVSIRPEHAGSFRDELEAFVETIEEPFDATMILPMLIYAAARRRGIGAVLDGVDGDTVASHEPDVLGALLRSWAFGDAAREAWGLARFYDGTYAPWSSAPRLLTAAAARAAAPEILKGLVRPARQKAWMRAAIDGSIIRRDFAARIDLPGRLRELWAHRAGRIGLPARELHAAELGHPQLAAALERYHRVAASQGIEARHPFLDKRVVELCLSLPWDQKLRHGWTKFIVRRATAGLLPDEVIWRRGRWVRLGGQFLDAAVRASSELLDRELSGGMDALAPYVDVAKVRSLCERHRRGESASGESLWTAAVLSSWLRKNGRKRYDVSARVNGLAALPRVPAAG